MTTISEPPLTVQSIGDRIRHARKAKDLNQADLAGLIGVSQPAVANWESGVHDPRRLMLARLAATLDVSLDWLASGARSAQETDKHPAAAYLRRPLHHVPVITFEDAVQFLDRIDVDPHSFAEDYIPVTIGSAQVFAVFISDELLAPELPSGTLVVVDYADRRPVDGGYCLAAVEGKAVIRRWRAAPSRLETVAGDSRHVVSPFDVENAVIGSARVSIRIM